MRAFEFLIEAETPAPKKVGRDFQHVEDLVIVDGSHGAFEALADIQELAQGANDVTVKWDGSPAIFFGRNEQGQFVLTDTAGFSAKGYDGKVTSSDNLEKMLLSRGKEVNDLRMQFAGAMKGIWDKFESIVDPSFRGFIKGDLLYYSTPELDNNNSFTFKPNTVTYHIPKDSSIGKKIAASETGVVIHSYTSLDGTVAPVPANGNIKGINLNGPVMIQGPTVVNSTPTIDTTSIETIKNNVAKRATSIDSLLDDQRLAAEKMGDFKNVLYTFVNQQVDTGDMTNLNAKFDKWLVSSKVSGPKQAKFVAYRKSHAQAFADIFSTLEEIAAVKDMVVDQLDSASEVGASIDGKKGGEGYVKSKRSTKYVKRSHFTAANRAKTR
jgi:hypothetical protein